MHDLRITLSSLASAVLLALAATATLASPSFAAPPQRAPAWVEEEDVDRPGGDFERIEMRVGQKDLCAQECKDDPLCRAWTWVRRDVQGKKPVCYLKSHVPDAKPSDCCISGKLSRTHKFIGTQEPSTNLPGSDYLSAPLSRDDPGLCAAACGRDDQCLAYTYVKPGVQGAQAVCYLKEAVPARATDQSCCTSGIKREALVVFDFLKDTDLRGQDYHDFAVDTGGSGICEQACRADVDCRSYTYVKSTNATPEGRCWLKNALPSGRSAQCCVSGVKRAGGDAMNMGRGDFDRPGNDYHRFTPKVSDPSAQPSVCRDACGADPKCRAVTYVEPGVQGSDPWCYLKDQTSASGAVNKCCSSATKKAEWIGRSVPASQAHPILYFSRNDPGRLFAGLPFPADMPAVRLPGTFEGCSRGDADTIRRAWALAHHHLWRAHQVMQHVNRRDRDRGELWTYGFVNRMKDGDNYANWSPRAWFGSYEARRFRLSRRSIDKVFNERFRGRTFEVQCRATGGADAAHPCNAGDGFAANHIVLGKINFCADFFEDSSDFSRAQTVQHEIFHWLKIPDSGYWVSDSHDFWKSCRDYEAARKLYHDHAAFLGMNRGCRDWNHNRAVLTNDNYAWFATMLGNRIYTEQMRSFPAEDLH
jgi:hypothetical protein